MQLKLDNISKMENFNIINKKENPLFKRKEVQIEVNSKITPSHIDVEKLISEKLSTQAENIKIKKISGRFGSNNFLINVNIYDTNKDKNEIEQKSKKEKEAEKKAAEEAKKEAEAKKAAEEKQTSEQKTPKEEAKSEVKEQNA